MINDLKRILIEQLQSELQSPQYKNIEAISTEYGVEEYNLNIKDALDTTKPVLYKKFNWFEKNITKRDEYRKFKRELSLRKTALEALIEKYQNASHLLGLDLDFKSACELLKANNIPIVLSEEEKDVPNYWSDMDSLEDFVLVHKTAYPPNNDRIKSKKETQIQRCGSITLSGEEYRYLFQPERDSVHFSVNGEVGEHFYGNNWGDMKYVVLIPFKDIPLDSIGAAETVDTFTNGGVNLTTNTIILCPKSEAESISKNNANPMVVGYDGENALGYGNALISLLGYRRMRIGNRDWGSGTEKETERFKQQMEENGITVALHDNTIQAYEEVARTSYNQLAALLNVLRRNKDLLSQKENFDRAYDEIKNIMEQSIKKIGNSFNRTGETQDLETREIHYIQTILKLMSEAGIQLQDESKEEILASVENTDGTWYPITAYLSIISSKLLEQTISEEEQEVEQERNG